MRRPSFYLLGLLLPIVACGGDPLATLTVNIVTSQERTFDPYASDRLVLVRVTVDGDPLKSEDNASADLDLSARSHVFDSYPGNSRVSVKVGGYDESGNLIAYGKVEELELGEDEASVELPFRPNLAFITHQGGQPAESLMYVVDVTTRRLLERIELPGTLPEAEFVSSVGGEGVVVPYTEASGTGSSFVGFYSVATGSWTSIPLTHKATHAVLGAGRRYGAAAGAGRISIFDVESKTVVATTDAGAGNIADSAIGLAGKRGLFTNAQGLLRVRLDTPESPQVVEVEPINRASAIGVRGDGEIAYVASQSASGGAGTEIQTVTAFDLKRTQKKEYPAGFDGKGQVGPGVFSDRMNGFVAIRAEESKEAALAWSAFSLSGFGLATSVGLLPNPSDVAASPEGGRLIVVSAGTSTPSAGLTVIDTAFDAERPMDGSTVLYPRDTVDSYVVGKSRSGEDLLEYQRYQPKGVAILFGR